jgi:nucleoside-diphosphate-sugar epimerase
MLQSDYSTANRRRLLLTGATGFVGRALLQRLCAEGRAVRVLRRSENPSPALTGVSVDVLTVGDLEAATLDPHLFHNVDAVIHLAARVHQMSEDAKVAEAMHFRANAVTTERLAEAASRFGVRRFVYMSSIKVNGERTIGEPYSAASTPSPVDAYGRSKWAAEQSLVKLAADSNMSVAIIRPCLVVGPGAKGNLAVLARLLSAGIPLPLRAVLNRRSMVSLDNLVDLTIHAIDEDYSGLRLGLAADDVPVSTPEMVQALAAGLGRSARLLSVPASLLRQLGRWSGRMEQVGRVLDDLVVDNESAKASFNWRPRQTTADALRAMGIAYRLTH